MSQNASSPTMALQPVFAEGLVLSGFLDDKSFLEIPELLRAVQSEQAAVRQNLGKVDLTAPVDLPSANYRHPDETETIAALQQVIPLLPAANLSNLMGFEWIEVSTIAAGAYFAGPMPSSGQHPTSSSPLAEIVNYCLFGNSLGPQDILVKPSTGGFSVVSPEKIVTRPVPRFDLKSDAGIMIEFQIQRQVSPITVLSVRDRAVALRHQERLVALLASGVEEALCLVYYGYGLDLLNILPSLKTPFLSDGRIPMISDFLNNQLVSRVTVPKPKRVIAVVPINIDA